MITARERSEFLVIGELNNLILVIGELRGYILFSHATLCCQNKAIKFQTMYVSTIIMHIK